MRTLWRKLARDLTHNLGQLIAIAVVIACAVMVMIISSSNLTSLQNARNGFYQRAQLADLFVNLVRAPRSQLPQLTAIDGVQQVTARVQAMARVTVDGFNEPIQGLFISLEPLPVDSGEALNQLVLTSGQLPTERQQVVISQPFAEAHQLAQGDYITVILNGQAERLLISGVGISPEFVYQVGPSSILPDYLRYGTFWMQRPALESALELQGAFNHLSVRLQPDTNVEAVKQALDSTLKRAGGQGAVSRDDLPSEHFLANEIKQLKVMSIVLPAIFLSVAAFLLHVLLSRLIRVQRHPIALLKAFGYHDAEIIRHYLSFSVVIVTVGVLLGAAAGTLLAPVVANLYVKYFQFPEFTTALHLPSLAVACVVAYSAALLATWRAVRVIARQAPAESMRPPIPDSYTTTPVEARFAASQTSRMVVRHMVRHRWRSLLSVVGIALAGALLTFGSYMMTAFDDMLLNYFGRNQSMDLELVFSEAVNDHALYSLHSTAGVLYAEGYRQVPVRIRHQRFSQHSSLTGISKAPQDSLRGLDYRGVWPENSVLITDYLAQALHASPGDLLTIELLSDSQKQLQLPLVATIDEALGQGVYMDRHALNRLIGEGPAINGAWVLTDGQLNQSLLQKLYSMPKLIGIREVAKSEQEVRQYIDDTVLGFMLVLLSLAGSITVAVIYNNARVVFAERERELATMRVLGYTHTEVTWLLVAEVLLLIVFAIPIAWLLGSGFSLLLLESIGTDMYRASWAFKLQPYAFSTLGVLAAAAFALALVIKKLHRLDILSALKTES